MGQRQAQMVLGDAGSSKRPSELEFDMMGKGIQWKQYKDQSDGLSASNKEDNLTAVSL